MSGWTIATIVLSVYLLAFIVLFIDTGIDAKWNKDNWFSCILFMVLFPLSLPFAIWNWIHEAKERKKKKQAEIKANIEEAKKDGTAIID